MLYPETKVINKTEEEIDEETKGQPVTAHYGNFLSTALVVGMTANAMPMHVLAQENVEGQDKAGDGTNDPKDNPDDDLGGNPGITQKIIRETTRRTIRMPTRTVIRRTIRMTIHHSFRLKFYRGG